MADAKPVILDADMGSDDAWLLAMLLSEPARFSLLGVTTVFGNTGVGNATRNATALLSWLGHGDVPVHEGLGLPVRGPAMFGDGAYGEDGFGGVVLGTPREPASRDAVSWLQATLEAADKPVTLFASGPLTNIAALLQRAPQLAAKIEHAYIMGGALRPGPKPEPANRIGNITLYAEFNFFQDPGAANIVFSSGLKCSLLTMDANQHSALDAPRKQLMRDKGLGVFVDMMGTVEEYDVTKFGMAGAAMHDPNLFTYALYPELYDEIVPMAVRLDESAKDAENPGKHGLMGATIAPGSPVELVLGMKDGETIFAHFVKALETVLPKN